MTWIDGIDGKLHPYISDTYDDWFCMNAESDPHICMPYNDWQGSLWPGHQVKSLPSTHGTEQPSG